jgi:cytochrome-b5 reductase
VNEDKIKRYGHPPSDDTLVVVCGLPGVYDKLCGPRSELDLAPGSALANLGYTGPMVAKL